MQEPQSEAKQTGVNTLGQAAPGSVTFTPGSASGAPTSPLEANKELVRRYEKAFISGQFDLFDEVVAKDYKENMPMPDLKPGLEGLKAMATGMKEVFSDLRQEEQELFAEGDRVIERWKLRMKHTGPEAFLGVKPTGKEITFTGIDIFRIADGKIAEHWSEANLLGTLQQLGATSIPGTSPS